MGTITDPYTFSAGTSAVAAQVNARFDAILDEVNGNVDTENIAPAVLEDLGVSDASTVRRGKTVVATEQSTTSASYALLTTPDRVQNVVMPTDGLIVIGYQALWKESVVGAARAALFLDTDQVKVGAGGAAPGVQEANNAGTVNLYTPLHTYGVGLDSTAAFAADSSQVTTGQLIGNSSDSTGGLCAIFAAAGTYDVAVLFKTSSGTVTAKERKLWVWTMGF